MAELSARYGQVLAMALRSWGQVVDSAAQEELTVFMTVLVAV